MNSTKKEISGPEVLDASTTLQHNTRKKTLQTAKMTEICPHPTAGRRHLELDASKESSSSVGDAGKGELPLRSDVRKPVTRARNGVQKKKVVDQVRVFWFDARKSRGL
jgi:hypothetical protein